MTTATKTDHTNDVAAARQRLEELRQERARLTTKQAELQRKVVAGRTGAEVDALAGRLIAGESADAVVDDFATLARAVADQIAIVDKATAMLADVVKLHEYRQQQLAAVPKFQAARAHIKRLDVALLAVERIVREAQADLTAFDDAAGINPNATHDGTYADEPRLFEPSQLIPLRAWPVADYFDPNDPQGKAPVTESAFAASGSRYRRWRLEAERLGAL